jgi:hypothetical protein
MMNTSGRPRMVVPHRSAAGVYGGGWGGDGGVGVWVCGGEGEHESLGALAFIVGYMCVSSSGGGGERKASRRAQKLGPKEDHRDVFKLDA